MIPLLASCHVLLKVGKNWLPGKAVSLPALVLPVCLLAGCRSLVFVLGGPELCRQMMPSWPIMAEPHLAGGVYDGWLGYVSGLQCIGCTSVTLPVSTGPVGCQKCRALFLKKLFILGEALWALCTTAVDLIFHLAASAACVRPRG